MLRSLFTGISGLQAHQKMLDVTANNIANVNTTGFKSSAIVFEDALSQTLAGAGAATGTTGATNPIQIGLGVHVAATNQNFSQGSNETTGVPTNLMINGDGFFMAVKNGQQVYTRSGAFTLDPTGSLVTADGAQVQDSAGAVLNLASLQDGTYVSYSIDASGNITGMTGAGTTAPVGQVGLATFPNPNGLAKIGNSNFTVSGSSGLPVVGAPGTLSAGTLSEGYVEMSNVDLSQELTNLIVAQRGFQANSKVITTSDEILQTLVNLKN